MAYSFVFLTQDFYDDYKSCPEIEQKLNRPHLRILITVNNITFAVPFRSNIAHPHAFLTDKANKCGLDFSKAVVLHDPEKYIDKVRSPRIRQNEFNALKGKEHFILQRFTKYIHDYIKATEKPQVPRNAKLLEYSTLQYFPETIALFRKE